MNLDELRAVRDDERATGDLQPLRPSFYAEAREFIDEIEEERDRQFDAADDPLSDPDVVRLSDKLSSAKEVLESILENRASKLLTQAMTVAAGEQAEPPEMTAEEAELYRVVVDAIRSTKQAAIEGDPTEMPVIDETPADTPDEPPIDGPESSPEDGVVEPPSDAGTSDQDDENDRLLVRVVDDVGTILGVDEREYDLGTGDVVSLPIENARALIEREVAEAVESE